MAWHGGLPCKVAQCLEIDSLEKSSRSPLFCKLPASLLTFPLPAGKQSPQRAPASRINSPLPLLQHCSGYNRGNPSSCLRPVALPLPFRRLDSMAFSGTSCNLLMAFLLSMPPPQHSNQTYFILLLTVLIIKAEDCHMASETLCGLFASQTHFIPTSSLLSGLLLIWPSLSPLDTHWSFP